MKTIVGESYGKSIMRKWHTTNHCDKSYKHRRLTASQICDIPNHSQNPVSHMLFKESHKLTPVSVLLRSYISKFFKIHWKIEKGGWALSVIEVLSEALELHLLLSSSRERNKYFCVSSNPFDFYFTIIWHYGKEN